jgi:UDP-N-acetylglucosamine 2-epimerase (non-hydrolysing)
MSPCDHFRVTHLVIGTKAQFIKMAPVARLMEERGWPYRLLDLGQHGSITPGILRDFGLQADHVHVFPAGVTISTYWQALRWLSSAIVLMMKRRRTLRDALVREPAGYALVHGDTLSTLLGLYLSKRLGLPVGLVEAGLSSGRLLDPFPEEFVRRHVERHADILFAPGNEPAQRLCDRLPGAKVVDTGYNTGRDALRLVTNLHSRAGPSYPPARTILTLHRAETITRPSRLRLIIRHVVNLAEDLAPIRFYLHEPTRRALVKTGLMDGLVADPRFEIRNLADYPEFMAALAQARYVLTDGGSIQEEASYLDKPCLILRKRTERNDGLKATAALTSLDPQCDLAFLTRTGNSTTQAPSFLLHSQASAVILDNLMFTPR